MPSIIGGLVIAAVIIFFILLLHFRKISIAALIFASLLLCLFGTAAGILIQGVDLSITCILGVVSLMGILVRNGIIMFDYAEELRATEGMHAEEAIYHSAQRRMRPIFLTSAAASMGVIPMILGGSGLWLPWHGDMLRHADNHDVHPDRAAGCLPADIPRHHGAQEKSGRYRRAIKSKH